MNSQPDEVQTRNALGEDLQSSHNGGLVDLSEDCGRRSSVQAALADEENVQNTATAAVDDVAQELDHAIDLEGAHVFNQALENEEVPEAVGVAAPAPAPPIRKHQDRNAKMQGLRTWDDRTKYARMSYEERKNYRETYHRQRTQRRRSINMRRHVTPSVVSADSAEKKAVAAVDSKQ